MCIDYSTREPETSFKKAADIDLEIQSANLRFRMLLVDDAYVRSTHFVRVSEVCTHQVPLPRGQEHMGGT